MAQQLLDLITTAPGNFVYHLAVGVSLLAALQLAHQFKQENASPEHTRRIRALQILLAGRLVIFTVGLAAFAGLFDARYILPIFDRAVMSLSLAWVAWAWLQNGPNRLLDMALLGIHLAAAILMVAVLTGWTQAAITTAFSETWYRLYWELFSVLIVVGIGIWLYFRRPSAAASLLAFLAFHLVGSMVDLFLLHRPSDTSAALILAQLAAYPFLIKLPQRFPATKKPAPNAPAYPVQRERRRYATDRKTFQAVLQLATAAPDQLCTSITRFTSHIMVADLVFLAEVPDPAGEVSIEGGYALIQEEAWPGASLAANAIPAIAAALKEGQPLRIIKDGSGAMELTSLAATLGIKESGNFMLVPLLHEVNGPIGGLLLFSSYSQRVWSLADQEYLMAGTSYLVEILRGREQSALGGRIGGITTPLERDPGFIASIADADAAPVQPVVLPRSSDILPPLSGKMQTDAPISMIELPAEVPELARQQIQELQEALSYARQRLERLEKATDPTRANSENRLSTLLEGALLQAGRSFEDRHVTMRVDIPASLPALRGDPAALNDVLKIALEKALQDVAVAGTIVLKAQAGLSPEGTPHVHLKVISSGTPGQETSQSGIDAGTETTNGLLTRASLLMADQSGRLWVDTLAGGALVTNLLIPAEPEPRSMKPSPHPG